MGNYALLVESTWKKPTPDRLFLSISRCFKLQMGGAPERLIRRLSKNLSTRHLLHF